LPRNVFNKYNGKYLSVYNNPKILEGEWNYTRTILIEFKNAGDFNNWYNSTDCDTILGDLKE
jgi:uncharacterized protein (DUF1330 family)